MPPLSGVVKHLIIINVLVFIGVRIFMPDNWIMFSMFWPESQLFRPYQIVTHMFMHANPAHLLFNMFGLYMFGSILEYYWGPKKFLTYYLITGFGALIIHLIFWYFELRELNPQQYQLYLTRPSLVPVAGSVLGASGAVFGLLMAYGFLFPNNRIMLLFPPIPMKAKYFVLLFAAIELFSGLGMERTGVAHFAHLGGAFTGLILLLYWRKTGK